MKVWILQTGEPIHTDTGGLRPMRAINLTDALVSRGHEVVLWTSNFDHFTKTHRFANPKKLQISDKIAIRLIPSIGYTSHISLRRLFDHLQLAINLRLRIGQESSPDLIVLGFPPIETAWAMMRWGKKRNIPVVVDVKDAWPEIWLDNLPKFIASILRLLLHPYFKISRSTLSSASAICAPTESFIRWSNEFSGRHEGKFDKVLYLTSRDVSKSMDYQSDKGFEINKLGIYSDGRFRCSFVGTLNSAFDFEPIFRMAEENEIEVVIAGNGPQLVSLRERAKQLTNVKFTGWISARQASELALCSTFLLAPYIESSNFNMHIPNKFFDAMMHGKPIVTSIKGLGNDIAVRNRIGLVYDRKEIDALSNLIQQFPQSHKIWGELSVNAREIYDENFSYEKVYVLYVQHLEEMMRCFGYSK
jgi:glycosyltransferase involved in cell wall biosynthesis